MSRPIKVMGNHVMYDRSAWLLRVIMSSSPTLYCFPSVKKQKHDFHFFFPSVYKKTTIIIIGFGFCDIQNNQGLGRGYQPQPPALIWLITVTSTLIILDITKTDWNIIISVFQISEGSRVKNPTKVTYMTRQTDRKLVKFWWK